MLFVECVFWSVWDCLFPDNIQSSDMVGLLKIERKKKGLDLRFVFVNLVLSVLPDQQAS